MTFNDIDTDTVRDTLARIIAAANGGAFPDRLDILVGPAAVTDSTPVYDRTRLLVTVEADGRLSVDVAVPTHWTTLHHPGHRFTRTPGGALVLLGTHRGRRMHVRFEDALVVCDLGSPLLTAAQEQEAMAAFDAEFAGLVAEAA